MMLPSGRLLDAYGAHRLATIGAAFWSVAQMLTGAASGFGTMLLAGLGLGAGEAPTFPGLSRRAGLGSVELTRPWRSAASRLARCLARLECAAGGVAGFCLDPGDRSATRRAK